MLINLFFMKLNEESSPCPFDALASLGRKSLEADAKIVEANAVTLITSISQAKASKFQVPWVGGCSGQLPLIFLWAVQASCDSCILFLQAWGHFLKCFNHCTYLEYLKVTIYSSFLAANMIIYRSLISLTGIPLIFCQACLMTTEVPLVATLGSGFPEQITRSSFSSCVLDKDAGSTLPSRVHLEYFKRNPDTGMVLGELSPCFQLLCYCR